MITSTSEVTVRYAETDMMGVVYHGSYLPWLEIARTQMLRELGILYRELEEDGYFLPVLSVQLTYRRPARYDDVVTVQSWIREKPSLRIRIDYEVRRGTELLATAETTHAFIDRQGMPVRPPENVTATLARAFPKV